MQQTKLKPYDAFQVGHRVFELHEAKYGHFDMVLFFNQTKPVELEKGASTVTSSVMIHNFRNLSKPAYK